MSELTDDADFIAEVAEAIAGEFDLELKALPNTEFMTFIAAAKAAHRLILSRSHREAETGVSVDWRCEHCDCWSHERVAVQNLVDGKFSPGNYVRCVNCKDVSYLPLASPQRDTEGREITEEWTCTDFVADPSGSARCASCGKRRHQHPSAALQSIQERT